MINELLRDQRPLIISGGVFVIATGILLTLTQIDSTQILGINRWIKPVKFAGSAAIFLITIAVYLQYISSLGMSKSIIVWGTILIMFGEVFLIVMQAARGTKSHFNISNAFDGAVFSAMGLMILTNTLLVAYLAFQYFRADIDLPPALAWGLRLGLVVFIFGSIEGGYMSAQAGHTVGAPDGGNGLPFVNWSTTNGDLRVAHFIGLHALQIIPIAAFVFEFLRSKFSIPSPLKLTIVFAAIYFAAFNFLFMQALLARPVVRVQEEVLRFN